MKNPQENLAILNIWSPNVTTSTRETTTRAWIYDVLMAQFVLKIEKLSHIMGPRGSQDLRSPSPIMAPAADHLVHIKPWPAVGHLDTSNRNKKLKVYAQLWLAYMHATCLIMHTRPFKVFVLLWPYLLCHQKKNAEKYRFSITMCLRTE